ncbi:MAG: hypothetical protein A3A94_00590 [Candidatus Portnoybacteria bacterium RIFCSPLOWO2_01_FULL_43_11]|uniref:histidine kinase n=4 Tax=Candidatus Portnoyibacteriota TaxID=1817913 RepID=A0A1G2FAM9_9BACT|nr:MAG: hypothetical protein A2815_02180 [Candidatus Portnoybacteria bacterium RIFCSPHIGHO2_01_FULL_40_12b]OGZ36986.1 MAG: hypothetical protein A3D38_00710 [Candidatus Portnoybacteria bacterium RIFCSPHIGHO2_02_FULL_40_23]OGZ37613.1 MAG: hypothetical protein A3E90_02205 [Candidatus Portnoybacteria bacterium RIFCSPHIGHO2_12_FULL_40_11]OGZ38343.1 MAG: hypothetical protein A3A94_00590 [Candidatus Portnoybacteria bacterium RIFCSPLOWO2_01_FULL_43_11]OGZ39593.1 MAG: hypothetical protein A3I20_00315 [C
MGEIKDRKDIVNHTIWVRWAFLFTLVTFIVFLTVVVFDSPDKNKIIIAAVFHALFVSFYNIIHLIIYKKSKEGKPLNMFLRAWRPFLEYLILDNIAIAWGIYYSGGAESPIIYVYFISVILTAAAYSEKLILGIGSWSFLLYNALFWLEHEGSIPFLKFYPAYFGIHDNFITTFFVNFSFNVTLIIAVFLSTIISKTIQEREKKIIFEKERADNTIRNLSDGLIVLDNQNMITLMNPEAEKILGIKSEEAVGKKVSLEMFSSPKFQNLSRIVLIKKEEVAGETRPVEVNLEKPEKLTLQVISVPILDQNKKIIGTMKILHNISREKEISRMKSEFISIAAHQLRTPLSAVKWTFKMISDKDFGKINSEQEKFLKRGYDVNEQMIKLVNDLLNVSRIEEGKFGYKFGNVSLEKIIDNLIKMIKNIIEDKKIKFSFQKPQKPLPLIRADEERLSLAIQSIIDNAVNYTPNKGEVIISLKHSEANAVLEVHDTGIGIPKSQIERLFTKFFRADNVIRMQTKGTGLGLFITKNIIERHGGKIEIESQEGKGTTVKIYLPLEEKIALREEKFEKFFKEFSLEKEKKQKDFEKFIQKF